jgi:Flp pilus assembly protein TadG
MLTTPDLRKEHERGQVLALFTFGLVAMIAMVAFVVDGGNAFAQERRTQNGTDAAALAGATVLAERLGGASKTNADVLAAVTTTATAMEMTIDAAEYTDITGNPIGIGVTDTAIAPPLAAAGVAVTGRRPFETYFARAIGVNEFTAVTDAIAIAGYGQPWVSTLLPVTPPVNILTCDGQNRPAFELPLTRWETNRIYKVPLCKSAPGNVGWIDWSPPSGGTSELAACIADPSTPGCDHAIELPSWNYVAQTGNTNSGQVQTALREWDGRQVFLPLFDDTCGEDPGAPDADCPTGPNSGQGQGR